MAWWAWLLVVLAVAVIVGAVVGSIAMKRQRERTARLRERFGPEYDRAVKVADGRRSAESELEERLQRHRGLQLSAATDNDRARYEAEWRDVEAQFDGAELAALARADALVTTVLAERGYPMESFDQRAADLSVDYPEEVGHYRRAHSAYRRADDGEGTREDLYEALQHYLAFLDALLGPSRDSGGSAGPTVDADDASVTVSADGRPQRPPTPVEDPRAARRDVDQEVKQ